MFRPCTVTEAGSYTSSFPGSPPIREGYYLARDYEVRKHTEKLKPITSLNFDLEFHFPMTSDPMIMGRAAMGTKLNIASQHGAKLKMD